MKDTEKRNPEAVAPRQENTPGVSATGDGLSRGNNVPVEKFGKDHWNLFAYVETRCVDHRGYLDKNHMRTDPDRHPMHMGERVTMVSGGKGSIKKYPTRLKGDEVQSNHDDWDCLDDLVAAGLLMEPKEEGTGLNPCYRLTPEGVKVISDLRTHKMNGGTFATFEQKGE